MKKLFALILALLMLSACGVPLVEEEPVGEFFPYVMVGGKLYYTLPGLQGGEILMEMDESFISGYITSCTQKSDEFPEKDGQSNFPECLDKPYAFIDGDLYLFVSYENHYGHKNEYWIKMQRDRYIQKNQEKLKTIWEIDNKKFDVLVPEGTELIDNKEGYIEINSRGKSEEDFLYNYNFSEIYGGDYITELTLNIGDAEEVFMPMLPSAKNVYVNAGKVSYFYAEHLRCESLQLDGEYENIDIGDGPESLVLGAWNGDSFDLGEFAGAKNIRSISIYGKADLSLIKDIGNVEKVYAIGPEKDLSELENLKSLKHLTVFCNGADLSPIENLSMEILSLDNSLTQEVFNTLTVSKTIKDIHINDKNLSDISKLEKFSALETIILYVDGIQDKPVELSYDKPATREMLEKLKTSIPNEQLTALFDKDIEIYLINDWSRT